MFSASPHLILTDYGFTDPGVDSQLRTEAAARELTAADFVGKVLTPRDLAKWVRTDTHIEPHTRQLLIKNLFLCGAPVWVYSYTSREFFHWLGRISDREAGVREAFPKSQTYPLDTKAELYNGNEFDWDAPPQEVKYDSKFYSYQVTLLLDHVVETEVMLKELRGARYLRIGRIAKAHTRIGLVAAGVGYAATWAGALAVRLAALVGVAQTFVVVIAVVFVLILLGCGTTLLVERDIAGLFNPDLD